MKNRGIDYGVRRPMQSNVNLIGGQWVPPANGEYIPNINPATEEILGQFPNSGPADANAAVEAASTAQPAWAALSSHARGEFLRKAADILESRADQVARDLMLEEGKSLPEA